MANVMRRALLGTGLGWTILLIGCGGGSQSAAAPPVLNSIHVTGGSANLTVGQSQQMQAVGAYSNNSTQDLTATATWSSSDANVCAVATGGMLSTKSGGTCSIAAKVGSVSGSFGVTVAPALVSIAVTPASSSIAPDTTQQFTAIGTYTDNSTRNLTSSVTWISSSPTVATVSSTSPTAGLAKAMAAGNTNITANSGTVAGTAVLTVTSATAVSVVLAPTNVNLPLGLTQQFSANATFSDGTIQDVTGTATWKSSSSSIASITASGFATAKNVGSTNITVTFESVTATTPLTVNAANLTSISIQPSNGSIAQGTKIQLAAIGTFNDGGTRDVTHQATWSVSDPSVVNIGASNGLVLGTLPGLVNITATLGSATDSVPFTVTAARIVSISLTPSVTTVPISGRARFTATGIFDDSSTQDISMSSAWTSTNTAVATVGSTSGTYGSATGLNSGTTNINANFGYAGASAIGSAQLNVSTATLTSISLSPGSGLVAPGSALQFIATATFSDGTKQSLGSSLSWSSSDTNVATVSTAGAAVGQSPGVVTITATSGSVSGTASLVVESAALSSIQVAPQTASVPNTIQTQFKAIGTFANGDTQDLTSAVTWTSSSSSIATVSNAAGSIGVATGVQPGTVTISAVFKGQVGTASLTVTNATLSSIAVTPASPVISLGGSQAFTATGTFSDSSVMAVTNQVSWSSTNPAVATINANGSASGIASGTSTVTGTLNGVSGTAILTVQ
jgi:trimeric autotransporter adhesin